MTNLIKKFREDEKKDNPEYVYLRKITSEILEGVNLGYTQRFKLGFTSQKFAYAVYIPISNLQALRFTLCIIDIATKKLVIMKGFNDMQALNDYLDANY